jgi:hypothetical protein
MFWISTARRTDIGPETPVVVLKFPSLAARLALEVERRRSPRQALFQGCGIDEGFKKLEPGWRQVWVTVESFF